MQTIHQIILYLFLASLIGFVLAWFLRGFAVQRFKKDWLHESTQNRTLTTQIDQLRSELDGSQADRMDLAGKLNRETQLLEQSKAALDGLEARVLPAEQELNTARNQLKLAHEQQQEAVKKWQDAAAEVARLRTHLVETEKRHEQVQLDSLQKFQEQLKQSQIEATQKLEVLRQEMLDGSPQLGEIESLKAQIQAHTERSKNEREILLQDQQRQLNELQLQKEALLAASEQQMKTLQAQHAQEVQAFAQRHAQSMKMAQEHIASTTQALEQERVRLGETQDRLERMHGRHDLLLARFKEFETEILGLTQHHHRTHQLLQTMQEELTAS